MPRFIALIFIKVGLKLIYFCQKYKKFSSAGGYAPKPLQHLFPPFADSWLRACIRL